MRKIVAVAVASSVFGGTIGALAATAVRSQANPQAIAAAVAKVSDTRAEGTLASINTRLGALATNDLGPSATALKKLVVDLDPNSGELYALARGLGTELHGVAHNLYEICLNTATGTQGGILCTYAADSP